MVSVIALIAHYLGLADTVLVCNDLSVLGSCQPESYPHQKCSFDRKGDAWRVQNVIFSPIDVY